MKTKLLISKATAVVCLLASQLGLAQTGGAYGGTPPTIVNGTVIQFEDFDLGGNANGGTAPFGYSDTTLGNATNPTGTSWATSDYRASEGHDVDLALHVFANPPQNADNGQIGVAANTKDEFQYYTISVGETSANYFFRINYGHGASSNKRYRIEKLNFSDLTVNETLVDASNADGANALPATGNSFTLADFDAPPTFTLTAGETWVLKFTHLDGGPVFNHFQLINNLGTLSVDEAKMKANTLKAFPNPSSDGIFKINVDVEWEVYSMLGVKILEGKGQDVDLTSYAKGAYILKAANEIKMLISK